MCTYTYGIPLWSPPSCIARFYQSSNNQVDYIIHGIINGALSLIAEHNVYNSLYTTP